MNLTQVIHLSLGHQNNLLVLLQAIGLCVFYANVKQQRLCNVQEIPDGQTVVLGIVQWLETWEGCKNMEKFLFN